MPTSLFLSKSFWMIVASRRRTRASSTTAPCSPVLIALAAVAAFTPVHAHAQSFTRLGTGYVSGTATPQQISADGKVVVGTRRDLGGSSELSYFRWSEATGYRVLPLPSEFEPPNSSGSMGVSGDGSVVAGSMNRIEFEFNKSSYELSRWSVSGGGASQSTIPTPGNSEAFAYNYDVSADGSTIVGVIDIIPNWEGNQAHYIPAKWVNGVGQTLDVGDHFDGNALAASADGSVVVGYVGGRASRWTDVGLEVIGPENTGGISQVRAVAVDRTGLIVVIRSRLTGGGSIWATGYWTPDGYVPLPDVPGIPRAVSSDGSVIATSDGLWTSESGFQSLRDLLENAGLGDNIDGIADFNMSLRDLAGDGRTILGSISDDFGAVEPFIAYLGPVTDDDIIVNVTGNEEDLDNGSGHCDVDKDEVGDQCTLRAAIQTANVRAGRDSVSFNIEMPGPHTIDVGAALPAITEPVLIDATTQPGYAGMPVVTVTGMGETGFLLNVGESTLRGLAIGGFSSAGVHITGPGGNRIERSYIGLGADGASAVPNGVGVYIEGSSNNILGGADTATGNVISGNTGRGVYVTGASAAGNVIAGNRIGTTAAGTDAVPNESSGVEIDGAPDTRVGGDTEAERNVVSGNGSIGVEVRRESATGVVISGNYIGTDADGAAALENDGATTTGVLVHGAPGVQIGGRTTAERNVILGGIDIEGPGADGAVIQGNHVNIAANGSTVLDKEAYGGIVVRYADDVEIGGMTGVPGKAPGNVILASSVANDGISVLGEDSPEKGSSDNLQVLGNLIGLDASGSAARPILENGINIRGLVRDSRIGQPGGGNVIVTDGDVGILLLDLGEDIGAPDGAVVQANSIGTDAAGMETLGDTRDGIRVAGAGNVEIGGPGDGAGNRVIAATGIFVVGEGAPGISVTGNTVGLLADGRLRGPGFDMLDGIVILGTDESTIDANTIARYERGLLLASNGNVVTNNRIGTNPEGTAVRDNEYGIVVPREVTGVGDPIAVGNANIIGIKDAGNVISGNTAAGILIGPSVRFENQPGKAGLQSITTGAGITALISGASDNTIAFNRIGTNASGSQELGNLAGVYIHNGTGNQLLGNIVSGNEIGVLVAPIDKGDDPGETLFAGNIIGGSGTGEASIPNRQGVVINSSGGNLFAAAPLEEGGESVGNTVRGNSLAGIVFELSDPVVHAGNRISGTSFVAHPGPSIVLQDESGMYPDFAPKPPKLYQAYVSGGGAHVAYGAGVQADVQLYTATTCTGGTAEGVPTATLAGSPGTVGVDVPLSPGVALTDVFLAMTVTTDDGDGLTSAFSDCVRIAEQENTAEADVQPGQTGVVLDEAGVEVDVTENAAPAPPALSKGAAAGMLYATRYKGNAPAVDGEFDGESTSPDGTTVTPNRISATRHWMLRADGLDEGIVYTACVDIAGVDDVENTQRLVLVQRETAEHPWTPFASTLKKNDSSLCAAGLSGFGEIAIGEFSNMAVAVEPAPEPTAETAQSLTLDLSVYPNPARDAATISITLAKTERVEARVYDLLGREITRMVDGVLPAGSHRLPLSTAEFSPGVYLIRIHAGNQARTGRLAVVR